MTKAGGEIAAYVTASPIQNELAEIVGVSVIAKDVTDQNRLLNALIEKEKRSAHLEGLVESLTTISHYIRNAAAIISAKAEVSLEKNETAQYQAMCRTCVKEVRRINAVIESLSDMVKETKRSGSEVRTAEMTGAPTRVIDIENRIKEKLRKIDEES